MPSGFETYVAGTTDIQLKDSTIYFSLAQKGTLPAPAQWFNAKGSSQDTGYWWGEVTLPYNAAADEYTVVVIAPTTYSCAVFYAIRSKTTTAIKLILTCDVNNKQFKYWIFSTKRPPLNTSRKGLELYKDGNIVFASETPTLRPLMNNANNGTGIDTSGSKPVGVICNKQGYSYSYTWSNEGPNEIFYTEDEGVSGVYFNTQSQVQPYTFFRRAAGISNSGASGDGEIYRGNEADSYLFVDITGI